MSGRLQLAVFSGDRVAVYDLLPGRRLLIGRDESCDVRIDMAGVSRQHAVVHGGPPVEVEDLGSANGTIVALADRQSADAVTDPVKLVRLASKRCELDVGASINIGSASAVVRLAPALEIDRDGLVVADKAMREVYEEAGRAAKSALSILILGETGVGKDVLAQWIHEASPRKGKPLLALNCAALSESLLESELFGYEKGAFTGALQTRPGLLESADGGTVFLDEIGDLPAALQAKLLRVIERREVLRIGARQPRSIDVRFLSATNVDLEQAMERGTFRQDLYFRLNGIAVTVPPLRERRSEIVALAQRFLGDAGPITPEAVSVLEKYAWPGNVRELRNVMERAALVATGAPVVPSHLPKKLVDAVAPVSGTPETLRSAVADSEKKRILEALARCDGNQTRAAEVLGVSRRTLINRLEEYGIDRPRKK